MPLDMETVMQSVAELKVNAKSDFLPRLLLLKPEWLPRGFCAALNVVLRQLVDEGFEYFDVPPQYADRRCEFLRGRYLSSLVTHPLPNRFSAMFPGQFGGKGELVDAGSGDSESTLAEDIVADTFEEESVIVDDAECDDADDGCDIYLAESALEVADADYEGDVIVDTVVGGVRLVLTTAMLYQIEGFERVAYPVNRAAIEISGSELLEFQVSELLPRLLMLPIEPGDISRLVTTQLARVNADGYFSLVMRGETWSDTDYRYLLQFIATERERFHMENVLAPVRVRTAVKMPVYVGCAGVSADDFGIFGTRQCYDNYVRWMADVGESDAGDPLRYGYCYLLLFERERWVELMDQYRQPVIPFEELPSDGFSQRSDLAVGVNGRGHAHITVGGSLTPGEVVEKLRDGNYRLGGSTVVTREEMRPNDTWVGMLCVVIVVVVVLALGIAALIYMQQHG